LVTPPVSLYHGMNQTTILKIKIQNILYQNKNLDNNGRLLYTCRNT